MGDSYEEHLKSIGNKYNISESRWSGASNQSGQASSSGFSSGGNQSSYESYIAGLGEKYGYDYKSEIKPLRTIYIPTNEEMEVNRYFSDYDRLIQDYGNRLSSIGWSDGITANSELRDAISGFTQRDQNIRKYLDDNRLSLNPDYYNEVVSGLDSVAEDMRLLQDTYDQYALYFGQFGSQDEYDAWTMDTDDIWEKIYGSADAGDDILIVQDLLTSNMPYNRVYAQQDGRDMAVYDMVEANRNYISQKYGITFSEDYLDNYDQLNALYQRLYSGDAAANPVAYTTADGQEVTWQMLYDSRIANENDTPEKRIAWYQQQQRRLEDLKALRGASQARNAEIAAIEAAIRMYETGETNESGVYYGSKVVDDYSGLRSNPDFGSISANRTYRNASKEEMDAYDASISEGSRALNNGGYYDEQGNIRDAKGNIVQYADSPSVEDKLGLFLSASDEDIAEAYNILSASGGNYETTWADLLQEGDVNRWRFLKPEEVDIYYYLLGSQGQEAAYKYLDDMEIELGRRGTIQDRKMIDAATGWEKFGLNLLSFPLNLVGGAASTIDSASRFLTGRQYNPYSRAQTATQLGGYIRGSTAQDIDEWTGGAELPVLGFSAGDAYQSVMSMVDSMIGARIGGKGYQAIMSMGAAANEANKLYSQGASAEQIAAGSVAAGVAEWIFEKYSIENLISMKSPETLRQLITNALIQGGIEFSEESLTEIANIVSNGIIMQSQSDWARVLAENGGDYGKAIGQMAIQVTNAGIGGFISGFGSGLGQQGIAYVEQRSQNRKIGQYISAGNETNDLIGFAQDIGSKAGGEVQAKLQSQVDAIKRDSFRTNGGKNQAIGRLYNSVRSVMTEQNIQKISSALQNRGFDSKDASRISRAFVLSYQGENLTSQQEKLVQKYGNDKNVLDAISQVMENEGSIDVDNAGQKKSDKVESYADKVTKEADELDVNAEGKTIRTDTNEDIEPTGFESVGENGKLSTKGGQSVSIRSVAFASYDDAVLYNTIAKVSSSANIANTLLRQFRAQDSLSAIDFAAALMEAYEAGQIGEKTALELKDAEFAGKLTTGQREVVYNRGKRAAYQQAYQRQKDVKKKSGGKKEGKLHFDRKGRKFDSVRESSLAVMDTLSKALGVDIYVYESYVNEKGQRVYLSDRGEKKAPNGYYDPTDGSIHIDLNAGQDGKGTMLFTVAHELTHFIKDWSSVKYRALADALVKQYQKRGVTVSELVDNQIAKAEQNGREMSRPEAFDEVVADSMESMLTDENAAAFLERIAQRDKGLKEKIVSWLKDLAAKLKNALIAYKDVKPDSPEGKMVAEMEGFRKEIMGIYTSALVDAGENFRENGGNENTTREGGVKMQIREIGDSGRFYVQADRQVITGDDPALWGKQIERYINEQIRKEQDIALPTSDGHILLLTARSAYKLTDRHLSAIEKKVETLLPDDEYSLKGRVAAHIDELIQVARFDGYAPDALGKHENDIGEDGFNYFIAYFRDADGKYYRVPFSAAINEKEETTYSIGMIRQRSFPAGRGSSSNKEALKGGRKASGSIIYSSEAKSQEVKTAIQLAYEKALGKMADRREILSDRSSDGYGSMTYAEISAEQQRISEEERVLQEQERNLSSSPELLDAIDSYMNLGDDLKNLLRKKRAGDATQEEINRIDEVKKLREDALKHIADIQESTGLNDVSRRLDSIREEKKALRKAADEAWAREGAEKENKAIKKSGLTAEEYFRKKAIKEFHFTINFNEAGYLLPDGRMLNFSGGERNHRYRDHREIGTIYEATQGAAALNRFMSDGNIRIMAESPGIDIASGVEPTPEQYDAIRKFVNSHGSRERKFFVDFSDKDGSPAGKYSYEGAVRADRVINDIKYFYENGTTREQSNLHLFLSDRDPTVEATRAALEKENGKLREDVSRLRELLRLQGKVTGGTVMKPSSVDAAARWLNKYAGAKADVKELSRMLTEFYRFIATDKDYSWEDVHERAMVIAKYLQDNVQLKPKMSEYARDVLRDIRGIKITLDESQRAEVEYQYGSYEAFRKAAFGNVTFVKEGGIPLDSQWHEWASLYPGTFDSEITATDQPQALMDAIDALRNSDTTVMEYAYNRESIAQDLAVAVYDSYWRVDALRTVADRDQRKINDLTARQEELKGTISEKNAQIKKLRAEHRTEMDNLKKERDKTVSDLKQKRQEDMKKLRTDYRKKLEDTRTRYQESREKAVDSRNRAKMREQVKKTVNELNHLLLDGDKKRHVPESMRKAVAEILSAVNMETSTAEARSAAFERTVARYNQRIKMENDPTERARLEAARDAYIGKGDQFKAKIDALAKAYEDIKESADPGLQDAYSDAVSQYLFTLEARVGDTRLGDMTLDQLKTVQNVLRIVMSTIRNANKSFLNERAGTIEQQAKRCISEVSSTWRKKKEGESDVGRWLRGFHYRNLKPIYLMRAIGSDALTQAYNNLRRGEDTWYRDIQGGREFFLSQAGKYGYREWDFEKTTPFSDNSGGEVKLTLGQIMCLYAYAKQGDDTAEHLRIGGVVPEGEAVRVNRLKMKVTYHLNDATPHQLGPDEIGKIIGTLTKEQTDFADAMQDYLSTVMADKGNEVSLAMYGIKLFTMKDYFPIKSAEQYVNQKNEPVGEVKLKNSGFTNKRKPGSNNPIVLRDFMDVWADHVNEMSNYHAFVLAIEDFNRIINYQTARKEGAAPVSLKQTIQNYMGQEAVSAVRELIQDVNGGARVDPAATFASKAINLFKKNAVFSSTSVVIQQPSAIVRAAALIDPKYFSGKIIDREKVDPTWETIKKYAPVAGIKDMGYFDTNMGKSTVDYIKGPEHDGVKDVLTGIVKREKGSFDELLSMAPGYADKVTWCAIWEAVKRETAAKHPNLATRSEEFLKICGDRFTEVITQTQVYDSVFARSGNMRSKDKFMGMVTSFMAEPTTSINMIYDAVLQGMRGDKAYMRRAIGAVIGAAVLNAVLKSTIYAERDDDDDETFGEKYVSALVAALKDDVLFLVPNSIPFVRDIMSLVQGYSVERMDMELADDLISAVKKLYSDKATGEEKILGILGSFGNLLFPAKNMIREVTALVNLVDTFRNSESQTAMGIRNAVREGWSGKTVSNARQLYEARMAGDTAHEERIAARYENEKSANAAVVSAIKEAFMGGDLSEQEAQKHLILYGNTDAGEAYWKVKEWIYAKDKGTTDGYGKYNDLYDAILNGGDIQEAVEEFTENGYDEDEVMSNVKKEVGRWFWDDESETRISAEQASDILEKYFGMEQDEIQETILKWTMKKETGISYSELREAFQDDIVSEKEAASYLEKYGGMTQVEAQETIMRWKMVKETGIQYDDLKEAVMEQSVSESDAISYLKKYGCMTEYDAKERVADWRFEAEHGYAYDDIKSTYLDDEITRAEAIAVMTEIGGKSREDAEKKVAYWDYEEKTGVDYENRAQQYKRGIITRQQLRQALIDLGEYSGEDADIQIEVYDWEQSGLRGASFTRVKNWHEYCEPAGVSRDMWLKIALFSANTENDKDEDGNSIRYSAMKKVMAEINKLPISKDQKTAIARAIGWSEKNIARYKPW